MSTLIPKLESRAKASGLLFVFVGLITMLGPGASDAYLPAFPAMRASLATSDYMVQQSFTAYWAALSIMSLWHGILADALGRRTVVLSALAGFALASLGCALAPSIEILILLRFMQGLFAGAGAVVGRAIVRDLCTGAEIQRQLARISMMFAVAPVVAPALGGMLVRHFDWRAVFIALCGVSIALLAVGFWRLPETLVASRRTRLRPLPIIRACLEVLRNGRFRRSASVVTLCQAGLFVYVAGAPAVVLEHYRLKETDFHWLLAPMVAGLLLGGALSSRLAGRAAPATQVVAGFAIMFVAAGADLILSEAGFRIPPLTFLPIFAYAFGLMLVIPTTIAELMEGFPHMAGTASSCLSLVLSGGMALVSGVVVPAAAYSLSALAGAKLTLLVAGFLAWAWHRSARREPERREQRDD